MFCFQVCWVWIKFMMMMLLSVQELLAIPPFHLSPLAVCAGAPGYAPFHQPSLAVCAGAPGYAPVPPLTSCCLCRSSRLYPRSTNHLLLSVQELLAMPRSTNHLLLSMQELLAMPPFHQPSLAVCAGAPGYAPVPPTISCCLCRSSWLCPRSTNHLLLSVQELLAMPPFHQPSLAVCAGAPGYAPFHQPSLAVCAGAPGYAPVPPIISCCLCRSSWLCPRSTNHLLLSVQELLAMPPFHWWPRTSRGWPRWPPAGRRWAKRRRSRRNGSSWGPQPTSSGRTRHWESGSRVRGPSATWSGLRTIPGPSLWLLATSSYNC